MLTREKNRFVLAALGLTCLTAVSLSAAPAHAQTNRYAEDWARLQKVIGFASSAYGYVNSAVSAIRWLTGANGAPTGPTLEEIKTVVVEALREHHTQTTLDQVRATITTLIEIQNEMSSHARYMANPDDLMRQQWAINYLTTRLAIIETQAGSVLSTMQTMLERNANFRPEGYSMEKQAVAITPAYIALVPLHAAAMKMVGELLPSLAAGKAENIKNLLATAGKVHFRLVGTYSIRFQVCLPFLGCRHLFSPVGLDQSQMFKRQLYSYYHRLSNGNLNTYPALRWSQFQGIPLVDAALRSLANVDWAYKQRSNWTPFWLSETRVWLMDQYTDPNANWSKPKFADIPAAEIWHIWACDWTYPQNVCAKIEGQAN